jgi:hypothetical protein
MGTGCLDAKVSDVTGDKRKVWTRGLNQAMDRLALNAFRR